MSRTGRVILGVIALVVLTGGGWVVYDRLMAAMEAPEAGSRGGAAVVAVEAVDIRVGAVRRLRHFTGTLRARTEFEIAPQISGRLERLMVDVGDIVERGQVIARLDDSEHQQQVEQARAELLVAQATLEEKRSALANAQREYDRVVRLRGEGVASETELDTARFRRDAEESAVKVAEAQVAQRRAALGAAEVRLSWTRVVASWPEEDGRDTRVVGERFVDEGATISANAPLLLLMDTADLRGIVHVTERDYANLRVGQEATITTTSHPGREFAGRVVRMSPRFEEGSRQARVEMAVANPDLALTPGMFVRVSLELGRADEATIIPRQSLVRREGVQGVFVIENEEPVARFVPVELGIQEGERVQVVSPELSGRVVTLGQHLLTDGMAVIVPEVESGDEATIGLAEEASR